MAKSVNIQKMYKKYNSFGFPLQLGIENNIHYTRVHSILILWHYIANKGK